MNFTTSINYLKDTEDDDENDIKKNENESERKNVDMTMMTLIIKNVHILQKKYYCRIFNYFLKVRENRFDLIYIED